MTNKDLLLRIILLIKPYKSQLGVAMLSMVMVSVFGSAQAYLIKPLIDKIFISKNAFMLNMLPFALILVFFFKGIFYYLYTSILDITGQKIIKTLRTNIFIHIHNLPLSFFHKTPTGEIISRVINDATLIQYAVSRALIGILKDLFQVIGLLCVIFYLNWKMALMSISFLPLAVFAVARFGRRFRQLSINNQETVAQISNMLHETITGHRIVKAFGMEHYEIKRFSSLLAKLLGIISRDIKTSSLQHPIMEFLGGVGIAAVIWYGGHLVISDASTPGTFLSFMTALIMIYEPIKGISNINSPIQQGLAASNRIFSLLDIKPDILDSPSAKQLQSFSRSVTFDNVCFSYDGKTDVLKKINLKIRAGEVVALVGPSGGGKTTLINLIPRFFEVSSGRILIDDCDIRNVTQRSLRNQIAIVSQQTILFNDTIRNNIAYGEPDRPLDEIKNAAQTANALKFIESFPKGFDTIIGESGAKLSGGQQQRLSIARAILKNAPILILDEATSALDTESELEVQIALENLMKNRTTFVIAHRLSTIRKADRIVVIDDGKIVEEGTHEALIAQHGVYEKLHNMQRHDV